MTSVTIGSSVSSIGASAFQNCKNLTDVYLHPETAPGISSNSFGPNKITLHVPNATYLKEPWLSFGTVVPLTGDEFEGADNTIITFDDETVKQKFIGVCDYTGDGEISMWEAAAVTSIPSFQSYKMTSLNELKYFTGVRTIPKETFLGCSNLISITIPEKVTSIGDYAFSGCSSLSSIAIPENVTSIGEAAFSVCRSLSSIAIPENVTTIGESVFSYCSSLSSINIPEKVTSIPSKAFLDCSNLISITIPEKVTSIGDYAFSGCI